jgi:uncharacterized protein involved in tolerance to divalent cations
MEEQSPYRLVMTTIGTHPQAVELGEQLVSAKLAACRAKLSKAMSIYCSSRHDTSVSIWSCNT